MNLSAPLHRRLDSEFLLHCNNRFKNVEVKKLGKKLIDEFDADSFSHSNVRNCGLRNCVIENWHLFL